MASHGVSSAGFWQLIRPIGSDHKRRAGSAFGGSTLLATLLMATLVTIAGCSLFSGGGTTTQGSSVSLNQLSWCDTPVVIFQNGASDKIVNDWSKVQGQLGFTYYLPPTLPRSACLDLVGGSIHDPIYGGHLSITYQLPKIGALSFSEAPKHGSIVTSLQCLPSPADKKTTICTGPINQTVVTLAAQDSTKDLQDIFKSLKPNVDWYPLNSPAITPTS
ncbi:MAG TPA: hypothetical protein VKQ36_01200 [Ktedonobacterales bacterium]|nr:hypothetical protein [Ktedonobacterales bacterium]